MIILLFTVILSCNVFSQNVTDSTRVVLSTEVARKVAAELVEKDMLVSQSKILRDSIGILEEINAEQIATIIDYKKQELVYSLKFQGYDKQLQEDRVLQENLKQQVKTNRAWAIGLGGTTVLSMLSMILIIIL